MVLAWDGGAGGRYRSTRGFPEPQASTGGGGCTGIPLPKGLPRGQGRRDGDAPQEGRQHRVSPRVLSCRAGGAWGLGEGGHRGPHSSTGGEHGASPPSSGMEQGGSHPTAQMGKGEGDHPTAAGLGREPHMAGGGGGGGFCTTAITAGGCTERGGGPQNGGWGRGRPPHSGH